VDGVPQLGKLTGDLVRFVANSHPMTISPALPGPAVDGGVGR
jgi:hypothetical protein